MPLATTGSLRIVHYGHPVLRERARPLGRITREARILVRHMAELLREAGGLGLAANQVGIPTRVAIVQMEDRLATLLDPEIVSARGCETAVEGCLSLPRLYGQVARPTEVVVRARNLSGRRIEIVGQGLLARALCHEVDHLNGKLFIDLVDESTLHWLVAPAAEDADAVTQATSLEEALKVFSSAHAASVRER